jgi:hypothetical protein
MNPVETIQQQREREKREREAALHIDEVLTPLPDKVWPTIAPTDPLDIQVGGDHYKKHGEYQPWQVLAEWMTPAELRGFAKGTAIVYLAREADKGGDLDIAKAIHTLQLWETVRKDK